jgi:RNA-binding protein 39
VLSLDRLFSGLTLRAEDVPPSAAEDDRDERTVFVQNVPTKATDKEIKDFFMQAGKVTDVRMISDKYSGKSKGYAVDIFLRRRF